MCTNTVINSKLAGPLMATATQFCTDDCSTIGYLTSWHWIMFSISVCVLYVVLRSLSLTTDFPSMLYWLLHVLSLLGFGLVFCRSTPGITGWWGLCRHLGFICVFIRIVTSSRVPTGAMHTSFALLIQRRRFCSAIALYIAFHLFSQTQSLVRFIRYVAG
jgi:hypothetical protein